MTKNQFLYLFFLINLILSSFYLDSWRNPNTTSRVLQIRSLHEEGVLHIDKYHEKTIDKSFVNDHYYPDKAPFPSLIVYPFYSMLAKSGIAPEPKEDDGEFIFLLGSFLTGSLCFTLLLLLVYNRLVKHGLDQYMAVLLSTLPFYGSMFFVYAGTFYAHLMVVLFLIISLSLIEGKKNLLIAGFFSGAAFFSEYLTAIFCFIWFFQIWKNQSIKQAFFYGLGILPFVLTFFWYNLTVTGNPLKTAYAYQVYYELENGGFSLPSIKAMALMIFSPWRGMLIYTSIFVAFIPILIKSGRIYLKSLVESYALLPSILFFITLSAFGEWHGGWTYGTRYLFPALGILLFTYLPLLKFSGIKRLWIALPLALGLIHAFMAKFTIQYSIPSEFKLPFIQKIWPELMNGNFNNNGILTRLFDATPENSVVFFMMIFSSFLLLTFYLNKKSLNP